MANTSPMYVPKVAMLFGAYSCCFYVLTALMMTTTTTTTTTTATTTATATILVHAWQLQFHSHHHRCNGRSCYGTRSSIVASSLLLSSSSSTTPLSISSCSACGSCQSSSSSSSSSSYQLSLSSLISHSSSSCRHRHCRHLFSQPIDNVDTDNDNDNDNDNNANAGNSEANTPVIIDGKKTAAAIRTELAEEIRELQECHGVTPGLAVVLVGERVDSATYVRMKKKAAAEVGIHSIDVTLDATISEKDLVAEIEALNADPKVHGILVQLPLPDHMNEAKVLKTIDYEKDADGFDATNIGNLWLRGGEPPLAIPCTPAGCIELLQRYNIPISGKDCVVLGRSNIVGMPVAALLQSCNGTVTVCHSRTKNIPDIVRRADIVIAAIGKTEFVKGDWLKPGAVVIDVGINDKPDPSKKRGYRLVGDVDFEEAVTKASAITPVPGGVGPMTIAMLLKNTVNLCRHSLGLPRLQLRDRSKDGDYKESSKLVNVHEENK